MWFLLLFSAITSDALMAICKSWRFIFRFIDVNAMYIWFYDVKRHWCVLPRRSNLSECREPSGGLMCRKLDPFLLVMVMSELSRVLVGFIAFSDLVTLFIVELVLI